MGVILAAIGLYGLISFLVAQRTQEIGVRMAIGAAPRHIHRLVFGRGLRTLCVGLIIGIGASLGLNRFLSSSLINVSPADLITYLAVCSMLTVATVLGCWIPAWRATRIDPVIALQQE